MTMYLGNDALLLPMPMGTHRPACSQRRRCGGFLSITIKKPARLLELSHQGAANNIHKLEDAGILQEMTGRKRNQVFVAPGILRFMYDRPTDEDAAS